VAGVYGAVSVGMLVLVSGCASTAKVGDYLQQKYFGKSVEIFLANNGPSRSNQQLGDRSFVYEWSSAKQNVGVPSTTYATGQVNNSGAFTTTSETYGGGAIVLECRLRILVGPDNVVREFVIEYDSIGMWHKTRCHEVIDDWDEGGCAFRRTGRSDAAKDCGSRGLPGARLDASATTGMDAARGSERGPLNTVTRVARVP
jgi:hypothetical protein